MPLEDKEIRLTKSGRAFSGFLELTLNADQILMLQKLGKKRLLRPGERLLSVGSIVDRVYILKAGAAEILAPGSNGEGQMMKAVGPGEILGLTEALAGTTSNFSISATSESVFTEIPREEFITFLRKDADMCFDLVSMMATAFVQCIHVVSG